MLQISPLKLLNLQPAEEEGKLDGEEERIEQVQLLLGVTEGKTHGVLKKKKLGSQRYNKTINCVCSPYKPRHFRA